MTHSNSTPKTDKHKNLPIMTHEKKHAFAEQVVLQYLLKIEGV